uniref:Uncharacterized protein n=1 Tax=uncultured actinobacterium HF0130_15N16 TaxID=723601 RepID=E7C2P3_9ACTN|nr:hypothetical protein [uncultured actinobacterium HF0130_15N16]
MGRSTGSSSSRAMGNLVGFCCSEAKLAPARKTQSELDSDDVALWSFGGIAFLWDCPASTS